MGLTITFGFYVERDREVDAFVELWRRLGGRIAHAREFRAGKEVELVASPPTRAEIDSFKAVGVSVEQIAAHALDEDWVREAARSLGPSDSNFHLEMDCMVGGFDMYVTLHLFGAAFRAGEARKYSGPIEATVSGYSLQQQQIACRSGSDDIACRALELFRLMLGWGTERPVVSHAVLYPEAGWNLINACAIYLVSVRQLPSLFLWLYLYARCGMSIPESIGMIDRGGSLPATKKMHDTTARVAKMLPEGERLTSFLANYDVARARALSETAPETVWDALRLAADGDPSWQLERSGDAILIANDAGRRVWELVVSSVETLE
jgi:hypothetical protein